MGTAVSCAHGWGAMIRNKIFFNLGNPSAAAGIGAMIQQVNAAGIPVYLAATDTMAGLYDLQKHAGQYNVPNVGNYRSSHRYDTVNGRRSASGDYDLDVPDYTLDPQYAAERHWGIHRTLIPPELNKRHIHISTINEPRHTVGWGSDTPNPRWSGDYEGWADWLGCFSFHSALLAMAEGYKHTCLNYAGGNPDEGTWDAPWMQELLRLVSLHPDVLSIGLHEYSLDKRSIWAGNGRLVGRFLDLFNACDRYGFGRVPVQITEWGRGRDRDSIPSPDEAIKDIDEVMRLLYSQHPSIVGVAYWSLVSGGEWAKTGPVVQPLIEPLREYTLTAVYDPPKAAPKPKQNGRAREPYKRTYWVIPAHLSEARRVDLYTRAAKANVTAGPSYDDAGIGEGLGSRTAVLWDVPQGERQAYRDWFAAHYGGTAVEFRS